MAKRDKGKGKGKGKTTLSRKFARRFGWIATVVLVLWGLVGEWYVHHPREWLAERHAAWPAFVVKPLVAFGGHLANLTDGLGWTGHDVVYEYDVPAPAGKVFFAGEPRRTGPAAPADVTAISHGDFVVGWSPSLRHPLWCAYHVTREARFEDGIRPSFLVDKTTPGAPHPDAYKHSGFDRGHMVPNHAMISRYGDAVRRQTFLMSNISPQTPALNRGVWCDVEHRIADFWTTRYGEIWVIVGAIPSTTSEKLSGSPVDVPEAYYQIILAQEGLDVRALAVLFTRDPDWDAWAAHNIVSIDDIEELTGLDFNPDLPAFIQDPLEAERPTRLWPVRARDILRLFLLRVSQSI